MPDPINYTLVSPSKVGAYAACQQRLVWDSDYPQPFTSSKWADFGTVCHYFTQSKLGCMPPEEPTKAQMLSAQEMCSSEASFVKRVDECSDLAVKVIKDWNILPAGAHWLSEVPAHDPDLLPQRRSRKNPEKIEGFGGSIDLMDSLKTIIVDLKFTKPPTALKVEYLWQLASYAMLKNVSHTTILWVMTDAKNFYSLSIDWTNPKRAAFLQNVRKFVERVGQVHWRNYAYPMKGDHCEYCPHTARCPLMSIDEPQLGNQPSTDADMSWLDEMNAKAGKAANTQPQMF